MLLVIIVILIIILILSYYCICNEKEIDIDDYKLNTKPEICPNDKYNIKDYKLINSNIIIHNKYKKELEGLKKNKYIIDQQRKQKKQEIIEKRNKEININSKKIKIIELQKKIDLLINNINSLKLSFKLELTKILNDQNNKLITNEDIDILIIDLRKNIIENNKLIDTTLDNLSQDAKNITDTTTFVEDEYEIQIKLTEEYISLLNIKNSILDKKINVYMKLKTNI